MLSNVLSKRVNKVGSEIIELGALGSVWQIESDSETHYSVLRFDVYHGTCDRLKNDSLIKKCLRLCGADIDSYTLDGLKINRLKVDVTVKPDNLVTFIVGQCLFSFKDVVGSCSFKRGDNNTFDFEPVGKHLKAMGIINAE